MRNRPDNWGELFRSLIQALIDVLRGELAVLKADWSVWGRRVAVVAALAGAAGALALLILVLVVVLVVVLFELWLGALWKAVLATIVLVLAVVAILGGVAWWMMGRAGNPVDQARERFEDHRRWWREELLIDPARPGEDEDDG